MGLGPFLPTFNEFGPYLSLKAQMVFRFQFVVLFLALIQYYNILDLNT